MVISALLFSLGACKLNNNSSESSSDTTSNALTYTINFESNGGTKVDPLNAKEGDSITKPSDPLRSGFTFDGWFEDNNSWNIPFSFNKMPGFNLTLFAKWKVLDASVVNAYRQDLLARSQPGHLYIHYRRFNQSNEEYRKWDIWVWPQNETGRIVDFVKNEDGSVYFDNYGGAMVDIDLNATYKDGGHDGKGNSTNQDVVFKKGDSFVSKIGFLITVKESRSAGTHWMSDGGDKYLETEKALEVTFYEGALHVFAVQDNVKDFSYDYAGEVFSNPYLSDDGGSVSLKHNNVNSSAAGFPLAPTSEDLRKLGVGYQIMVPSFADSDNDGFGDIRGIINKFDYFLYLNVESIWLTPIQLSDSYHGYDIIDYLKVDPKYGSKTSPHAVNGEVSEESAMEDYKDLLALAKTNNITVVMDLVINHTSINNTLFQESLSLDPTYRAYYHWRNHQNETLDNQVWHPYSTYDYSFYGKFASSMPELNYDYQKTRDKMVDIMDEWVNLGVGGFRIDAVKHAYMEEEIIPSSGDVIITDSGPSGNYNSNLTKNLNLFRELNARLKEKHPGVFMVGENFDGHAYRVAPYYEGLDSMLNFYMFYGLSQSVANGDKNPSWGKAATISAATGHGSNNFTPASGTQVKYGGPWNYRGQLETINKYRPNAVDSLFTSNHDLPRTINQVTGSLDSAGEISVRGTISSANKDKATKMAVAMNAATILLPGLSWIYYGDELGMSSNLPSGQSEKSPHADRFARQPFKWDQSGSDNATTGFSFSGGETFSISWDSYNQTLPGYAEQKDNANSPLRITKELTKLKSNQVFKTGSYYAFTDLNLFNNSRNVFAFERELNGVKYQVWINMSNSSTTLNNIAGSVELALYGASKTNLPAWGVLVTKL